MSSLAPIVEWWDEEEESQQALWDAGIVDAGSEGEPTIFHLWNNRGGSEAVSDMINVDISVRDKDGGTTDLRVAGQTEAIVRCQFYDYSRSGGDGQWGAINPATGVWEANYWTELIHNAPRPVISASGGHRTISGRENTADVVEDRDNYAIIKLKLYAKPDAGAGSIEWITRISYQYQ